MTDKIADELRALCMSDAECLSDHYRVNAFVRLGYTAADALDAKDKRIAELEAALRDVRGYVADVAVAGMLIGADQNETHTRVSAHGIAMLKIVDATLRALSQEQSNG